MAVYTATTALYSAVTTAYALCATGDTLIIPAGTATWTSRFSINKGITIRGAGLSSTVITNGIGVTSTLGGLIHFVPSYPSANTPFRVTGIGFECNWAGQGVNVINNTHNLINNVRIDHCRFNQSKARAIYTEGFVYGVADNNQFVDCENCLVNYGWIGGAWYNWEELPINRGSSTYFYFEDNTVSYSGAVSCMAVVAGGHGGKYVIRYNTIHNMNWLVCFDVHGNQNPVTATYDPNGSRALMAAEIYENTIDTARSNMWMAHLRGGSIIMYNNNWNTTATAISDDRLYITEEDGWSYGFVTTYPAYDSVSSTYIWNNKNHGTEVVPELQHPATYDSVLLEHNRDYWTLNASFDGTSGLGVGAYSSRPSSGLATGVGYFATDVGILYVATATNGWESFFTPYAYPHPLTVEGYHRNKMRFV